MSRLAAASSPYLLAHKDNPVDWYPWGPEAFAAAQAQNKPILLSIGYSACHWCHVMNQESFSDPDVAKILNENFVNVIVDREERPDVDQVYQAAANIMGNAGGWPLTTFLTPQRVPFVAGTFFPKEERAGLAPPFRRILDEVLRVGREDAAQVATVTANVTRELGNLWRRDMRGPIDNSTLDNAAVRIGQRFDVFFGGIVGQQPKFPTITHLEVLWRAYLRTARPQFLQLCANTLDNILLGGMWDHVGGGIFRYCLDERMLVPHFEKTLVDNALLLDLVTSLWQNNRNKLCGERIPELVQFLLRDMRKDGGFASSIASDSDGGDGAYYLWSEAEVDAALMGTFVAKFKAAYGISRDGNFNGRNILLRLGAGAPFPQSEADEALLARQRSLMLKARQERSAPLRDDKVLCDGNGLAIAALANAGGAFQNSAWITAAIETFDFVVKNLGEGDRLFHSWVNGRRGAPGFADDYAHMARAAIVLHEVTGEKRYLDHAKKWTRVLNERFWDEELGGYFFTASDAEPMIIRARMAFDQPAPSGNATMIKVLAALLMATADAAYAERINTLVGAFAGEAQRVFVSMPSYFSGLEYAAASTQMVVIGQLSNGRTHELMNAILGQALPNRFLSVVAPEEGFADNHPMRGRTMQNGQPTAYVCVRGQVSSPVTSAVTLSQMLQLPVQRPQPGARPS